MTDKNTLSRAYKWNILTLYTNTYSLFKGTKEIHLLDELLPTFPRWKCHLPPYGFLMSFSPFILIDHFLTYSNYLNNTNSPSFNSVPLGLQGYANCLEVALYWVSNMAETGQPFVLSEVNIIIKSKYPASGILDKLTTGQNLNCYSR